MNRVKSTKNRMSRGTSADSDSGVSSGDLMTNCNGTVNGSGYPAANRLSVAGSAAVTGSNINTIISAISGGGGRGSPINEDNGEESTESTLGFDSVLVLSIATNECPLLPGMMSEDKIIASIKHVRDGGEAAQASAGASRPNGLDEPVPEMIVEKRTRFSLSHDEGSIGNTSDNLEAVSEAASNHSVASSLDDVEQEDQPDNLSDMMSANVSGRGTPNVSGRDTPSSQVTEGDEGGALRGHAGAEEPRHRSPVQNIAVVVPKPAREDIEEKFGKFEIKPLVGGDETFSLVSDTWSTDVLASDSETIEAVDRELREERQDFHDQLLNRHLQELDRMQGTAGRFNQHHHVSGDGAGETFETASEAWSTDVLNSDSERLQEFDTDDSQSVARSDDAGRSEVEGEAGEAGAGPEVLLRPEILHQPPHSSTPDNITPRAQQSRSPVDMLQRAPDKNESSGNMILKPTPVLPASLSLDSGSSSGPPSTLKPLPPVPNSNQEEDWPLPSSAPPTIGFRPITAAQPPNDTNQANAPLIAPVIRQPVPRNAASGSRSNTSNLLAGPSCTSAPNCVNGTLNGPTASSSRLALEPSSDSLICFDNKNFNDGSLSCQKKLASGNSAEDSSLHLSTTSLASSCSSSSELNGRGLQNGGATSRELSGASSSALSPQLAINGVKEEHMSMSAATGAIPKSISFDKAVDADDGSDARGKKGFFKKIKFGVFKQRRKDGSSRDEVPYEGKLIVTTKLEDNCPTISESSDDILAKYRSKKVDTPDDANEEQSDCKEIEETDERLVIDPTDIQSSYAFSDAKRKLRLVLSAADCTGDEGSVDCPALTRSVQTHCRNNSNSTVVNCSDRQSRGPLSVWLCWQIAAARSLQDRQLLARLTEAHRCLQLFDEQGEEQLMQSLKEDHQRRAPYIAYLVRARQGLLTTCDHLEKLHKRVVSDTGIISKSLVSKCVQLFLDRPEVQLREFNRTFTTLSVPDEKVQHVSNFLDHLSHQIKGHAIWRNVSEEELALAEAALEQSVMAHIYDYALYPNGDVDVNRDKVLYDHIGKLATIITPNHKALRIPKIYQYECPWPSAQMELTLLAAYKTAGDKLRCVVRAAKTVLSLLSLAHATSVPAADDFMPVFVYVLIKANPPHLLSTIQYVTVYYEQRMEGEQRYWWTQLCSAVEFIKTMDYNP